jgi:EAL domain-containing protein (putative c-di-GMP-specific phosphodiesterase class I)
MRFAHENWGFFRPSLKSREDAEVVAAKALDALRVPFQFHDNEIFVTASIGISIAADDAHDVHELLRNADTAMYFAKERGKSTYQSFLPEMKGKALKRLTMESHLRRALERNEFIVHYQPQFDVNSRRMIGVEALLRWQHPEFGIVGPSEFIPIAEETGLIVPIGEWVLRQATLDVLAMHEKTSVPIYLAVNLSGRQFKDDDIADRILAIVADTGFPPELLEIEITESTLMDVSDDTLEKLNRLRNAGLSLSLDDFGTGYSSMSYLKRFPITRLKIDRSFVRDVPQDPDDAAIVQAIIAMGRSLKMSIIAEGVETQEQADFLKHSGCDNFQGYLLARPMTKDDVEKMLPQERAAAD